MLESLAAAGLHFSYNFSQPLFRDFSTAALHDSFKTGTTWVTLTLPSSAAIPGTTLDVSETQALCSDIWETLPRKFHHCDVGLFIITANFSVPASVTQVYYILIVLLSYYHNRFFSSMVQNPHTKCLGEPLISSDTSVFSILLDQQPITATKQAMNTMNSPWLFLPKGPKSFHNPPKTNIVRYFTATSHFWYQLLPTYPT